MTESHRNSLHSSLRSFVLIESFCVTAKFKRCIRLHTNRARGLSELDKDYTYSVNLIFTRPKMYPYADDKSVNPTGRKAKRPSHLITQACDFCKRRHMKCDGNHPCSQCHKRQQECLYSQRKKRGPKPKSQKVAKQPVVKTTPVETPLVTNVTVSNSPQSPKPPLTDADIRLLYQQVEQSQKKAELYKKKYNDVSQQHKILDLKLQEQQKSNTTDPSIQTVIRIERIQVLIEFIFMFTRSRLLFKIISIPRRRFHMFHVTILVLL